MMKTGRIPYYDERNENFLVRPFLSGIQVKRQKISWALPTWFPLDQRETSSCVGHGWAAFLAAKPVYNYTTQTVAHWFYQQARIQDRLMGNNWPEGASVLAGAKVLKKYNYSKEYLWAKTVDDIIDTVCSKGPVTIGTNWYNSMFGPVNGLIQVDKPKNPSSMGHCYLITGYDPDNIRGEVFEILNSWGSGWGLSGKAFIKVDDMAQLQEDGGDACILNELSHKGPSPWLKLRQRVGI